MLLLLLLPLLLDARLSRTLLLILSTTEASIWHSPLLLLLLGKTAAAAAAAAAATAVVGLAAAAAGAADRVLKCSATTLMYVAWFLSYCRAGWRGSAWTAKAEIEITSTHSSHKHTPALNVSMGEAWTIILVGA
jgi:hypothetical protein